MEWYFYHFSLFLLLFCHPDLFPILSYVHFSHYFASLSFPLYFYSIVLFHFIYFSFSVSLIVQCSSISCYSLNFYAHITATLFYSMFPHSILNLYSIFFQHWFSLFPLYDHQMIFSKIFLFFTYFISLIWTKLICKYQYIYIL